MLDLVGRVGCIVGCKVVLLSIIFGGNEKGFEGGPVLDHGWAFSPTVTVFVEKTCGFNVVVRPSHELGIVDHFVAFGGKELAIVQLVKQG